MKILSMKVLVIGTILLLSITQIYAARIKRQAMAGSAEGQTTEMQQSDNDMNLSGLADSLNTIPYIGGSIKGLLEYIAQSMITLDQLTNGFVSRMLGGSLPCIITLESGITCSGTSINGGVYQIFEDILDSIPSLILPSLMKGFILKFVQICMNPVADVMLGGITKSTNT